MNHLSRSLISALADAHEMARTTLNTLSDDVALRVLEEVDLLNERVGRARRYVGADDATFAACSQKAEIEIDRRNHNRKISIALRAARQLKQASAAF